ncbi:MAG: 50S ribosomal protein L6 [Firmicutes bacterium]|jgi:large subunit ribosomal protein L6|nr:50S ribosomal protein L6 [Bacillota bacterium]
MSRIGKRPISVPQGVTVDIDGRHVRVTGPKGALERTLNAEVTVEQEGEVVVVKPYGDPETPRVAAMWGLNRTLVANMVEGVSTGFQRTLELSGVGYRASKQGQDLVLTVGFSHPVRLSPAEGLEVQVPNPTTIHVLGRDKEAVGALAAHIRSIRPPEPYKGKGIRYQGERVRRKVGKTGKK